MAQRASTPTPTSRSSGTSSKSNKPDSSKPLSISTTARPPMIPTCLHVHAPQSLSLDGSSYTAKVSKQSGRRSDSQLAFQPGETQNYGSRPWHEWR
jgi:hypothetical protein